MNEYLYTFKFYGKKRDLKKFERRGFEILDDGVDKRGHFYVIGTTNPEMGSAVEMAITAKAIERKAGGT